MTRINVGYSAISGDAMPAWIAKDAGIFEKNGLDVQLVFFTGGTTAVMALVSADTPIAQLAGPVVLRFERFPFGFGRQYGLQIFHGWVLGFLRRQFRQRTRQERLHGRII